MPVQRARAKRQGVTKERWAGVSRRHRRATRCANGRRHVKRAGMRDNTLELLADVRVLAFSVRRSRLLFLQLAVLPLFELQPARCRLLGVTRDARRVCVRRGVLLCFTSDGGRSLSFRRRALHARRRSKFCGVPANGAAHFFLSLRRLVCPRTAHTSSGTQTLTSTNACTSAPRPTSHVPRPAHRTPHTAPHMQTPVKSAVGSVYPPTPASILKDITSVSRRLAPAPENLYQTQKRHSESPVHTPVHAASADANGKPTPVTTILV